jgi:hypothetical protein
LLLSGFYTDAQLYAAKRVVVQCVRLTSPASGILAISTTTSGFTR